MPPSAPGCGSTDGVADQGHPLDQYQGKDGGGEQKDGTEKAATLTSKPSWSPYTDDTEVNTLAFVQTPQYFKQNALMRAQGDVLAHENYAAYSREVRI